MLAVELHPEAGDARRYLRSTSRLLKKSERAVKNHEQIGIKTGPFMNQSAATLSFSTAC
jgi:hypothetical protein